MLREGDTAPKIQLETDSGEPFDLESMRGKKVVLFFYPKASTPGCTVEACELRDTFKMNQALHYTLLCDVDKKVVEAYGVWKEKNMYGKKVMGIERTTFVIDERGKIQKVFSKVKPAGHAAEVLAAV